MIGSRCSGEKHWNETRWRSTDRFHSSELTQNPFWFLCGNKTQRVSTRAPTSPQHQSDTLWHFCSLEKPMHYLSAFSKSCCIKNNISKKINNQQRAAQCIPDHLFMRRFLERKCRRNNFKVTVEFPSLLLLLHSQGADLQWQCRQTGGVQWVFIG